MDNVFNHITVLKKETIQNIFPSENLLNLFIHNKINKLNFVDATLGGGGHAEYLLETISCNSIMKSFEINFIGFDQDLNALNYTQNKLKNITSKHKNIHLYYEHNNFKNLSQIWRTKFPNEKIHGLYADFGVSSPQLDMGERGFSLVNDGPIDMRMDTGKSFTAKNILENYSEKELTRIFFDYGEEPKSRKLANAIVNDRKSNKLPLNSTVEFANYIKKILAYPNSRVHPATRAFQALRIEVNNELESINDLLQYLPDLMHENGKAGFISFHSLEDRLIKHAMRNWQKGKKANEKFIEKKESNIPLHLQLHLEENQYKGFGKEVPRGGVTATEEECRLNHRSRSARFRCFEFSKETRG